MCGIVGYIGPKNPIPVLVQGLRRLEYRGYDSAGIAVQQLNEDFYVRRAVGRVQNLEEELINPPTTGTGIAHTRWATHGGVTQANAHPHRSQNNQVVMVHNGIIENANPLREQLEAAGTVFQSETDSEVLVQIIAHLYAGKGPFVWSLATQSNAFNRFVKHFELSEEPGGLWSCFKTIQSVSFVLGMVRLWSWRWRR